MEIWEIYREEELIELVAELAKKYTGGQSTSVTFEKAQQLMEAVLYCIGMCEREQKNAYALCTAERMSAKEAYGLGYDLVLKKVKKMRRFYNVLMRDFCSYGNRNYEDTLLKGIPEFFRHYDARFEPQNHILTLDYPVLTPLEGFEGIDAIEQYLGCIRLEQKFMGAFDRQYVCRVLKEYDWNYKEQFYNLCGVLLQDVLHRVVQGRELDEKQVLKEIIWKKWNKDELLYEYLLAGFEDFCTGQYKKI